MNTVLTVTAVVNAPIEKVWQLWTDTWAITQWNAPSPDWHTPKADHDLRPGGLFTYRMEAKDGSFGFDFGGTFDVVQPPEYLEYTIGDGRKVKITFTATGDQTTIVQEFESENVNPLEVQQGGWQAILNNFKKYAEAVV